MSSSNLGQRTLCAKRRLRVSFLETKHWRIPTAETRNRDFATAPARFQLEPRVSGWDRERRPRKTPRTRALFRAAPQISWDVSGEPDRLAVGAGWGELVSGARSLICRESTADLSRSNREVRHASRDFGHHNRVERARIEARDPRPGSGREHAVSVPDEYRERIGDGTSRHRSHPAGYADRRYR